MEIRKNLWSRQVILIQSIWRSYHCRKKVQFFGRLPNDVWMIVLDFIDAKPYIYREIDNVINLRLIRYFWHPVNANSQEKMKTLSLVKKYKFILTNRTISNAFRLCFRLLKFHRFSRLNIQMTINSTLEVLCS